MVLFNLYDDWLKSISSYTVSAKLLFAKLWPGVMLLVCVCYLCAGILSSHSDSESAAC